MSKPRRYTRYAKFIIKEEILLETAEIFLIKKKKLLKISITFTIRALHLSYCVAAGFFLADIN